MSSVRGWQKSYNASSERSVSIGKVKMYAGQTYYLVKWQGLEEAQSPETYADIPTGGSRPLVNDFARTNNTLTKTHR